jgi:hypothetical protein
MKRCIFAVIAATALYGELTQASLIILGNLPETGDQSFGAIDAGTDNAGSSFMHIRQAISFTMPAIAHPLDHVDLRLLGYNTTAGDVAAIGFYADNGGDFPESLVGSPLIAPASNSDDVATFTFVPSDPLTFAASTKYWLVLDATSGEYQWRGSAPSITPTSQTGAIFGSQIAIVDNERRDVGPLISSVEIVSSSLLNNSGFHAARAWAW